MLREQRTGLLSHTTPLLPLKVLVAILVGASIIGCAAQTPATTEHAPVGAREDILVLRSIKEESIPKSDWCTPARTAFEPLDPSGGGFVSEERYSMWAVTVRPADGRISDAKANKVGELRACFRSTADPKVVAFFTEGRLAGVTFSGSGGNCVVLRLDFPEKGIRPVRCFLELRDLPAPYTSGVLTTNSVTSRAALGDATDPPGYVQSSIATVRLWRAP
jgi:hypothetical protein